MTMKGIDISNYQKNIDLGMLYGVEFVICKATQGNYFVDKYCDGFIQWCISNNKPWGFYHFGDSRNSATDEANYFLDNCSNYFGNGIPVLDWESLYDDSGNEVSNPSVAWVNEFVRVIYDKTGVWPWIYANPWRFNQGGVEENCGRWVANYPEVVHPGLDYNPGEPPFTNGVVCCWQYASDGKVKGYSGNLDLNEFYGDSGTWAAYVGSKSNETGDTEPLPVVSSGTFTDQTGAQYDVDIRKK